MKPIIKFGKWALILWLPLIAGLGYAQQEQAKTTEKSTQSKPEEEITSVTVFGKLNTKKVSERVRRLDSSKASNCSFSTTRSAAELEDEYLQFMYGKNRPRVNNAPTVDNVTETGEPADRREGEYRESFSDTAPGGTAEAGVALPEGCTQTDLNNAAGRNRILRKDKTLTEAFAAYDAGKFAEAIEIFKKSYAKIGYDEAAMALGDMYLFGQGTPPNIQEAIGWYTKLAEARYVKDHESPFNPAQPDEASLRVQAQVKLARIYMMGVGVPKNPKLARHWYEAASELSYVPAQYRLAQMSQNGYGSEKNLKAATKFYTEAAESGYAAAQYALAELYFYGDESPQSAKAAFEWYEQAAFNPYPDDKKTSAQYSLAQMYDQGLGTTANPQKAFALYKSAALAGHPDAQYALGVYFYSGELVEKNWTVARKLFEAAAAQQQSDAMFNLALMSMKGEGGDADKVKAYVWLTLAGKLGHTKAPAVANKLEAQLTPAQKTQAGELLKPASSKK